MAEHECIIGLLSHWEYSELITLEELEDHITDRIMFNVAVRSDPVLKSAKELYNKEWSLKDYADRRKSTNLQHFNYCPICGKCVDWKKIRS